jgi:hypothetical protein
VCACVRACEEQHWEPYHELESCMRAGQHCEWEQRERVPVVDERPRIGDNASHAIRHAVLHRAKVSERERSDA